MKRKYLIVALLFIVTMGADRAMAWSGFGHSAAAYIAEQHLTPKAKAKCREYLGHTLPFYSSWMDYWRNIEPFKETSAWHGNRVDENRQVDYSGKAIFHTERIIKELRNYKNLPDSLVRQNLIFLIHMIPDMHCPVHTSFPKEFFPKYRYSLLRKGKRLNYHGFWDASPAFRRKGWTIERYYNQIDLLDKKSAKALVKGKPRQWADDAAIQAERSFAITPPNTEVTKMEKEQVAEVLQLADEMILKGGYRLAAILNKIFK